MNPTNFQLLTNTAIFEHMAREDLSVVEERLISLEFEPGDLLFKEGASGRYICFVVKGTLEVLKQAEGEDEVIIAELTEGHSVGEMSIIDGLTCSATVRARTPATVMALTKEDFERIMQEFPHVGAQIFKGISTLLSMSLRRTSDDLAKLKAAAR
jgi:CRP/FNR family cyclic AMP-dependent transcriptional regulator